MIQKLSHAAFYVLDQEESKAFYVDKLGFDVKMDHKMDNGFRWLTVAPKGQPDLEIVLMASTPGPLLDERTCETIRELVKAGKMVSGVMRTADCQRTYEELKARGVEFIQPPTDRFYGVEATFKDNSGNWFSLTQPKESFT